MKYQKSKQYYIDLYDRHTIEECRSILSRSVNIEAINEKLKDKKLSSKDANHALNMAHYYYIYFYTGDRYIKKEETVRKWMERDEAHDKFFEEAKAPEDIPCLTCGRLMFMDHKYLNIGFDDKPDTVLFMYDCPLGHLPRRAFYDNGEEYRKKESTCPKCSSELEEKDKRTKNKLITLISCPNCDYKDKQEIDLTTKEKEPEVDSNYEKDRAKFCLSEKEGQEFIRSQENMKQLAHLMDEINEKEKNKDSYDKIAKLKKLKIIELEELLTPILEQAGFIKLHFKDPDNSKDVIVPFVTYDQKPDREERVSTSDLKKLLRKALKDTNWRLMTEGVAYRLGMLEGRFHGYDSEEDLLRLVKDK